MNYYLITMNYTSIASKLLILYLFKVAIPIKLSIFQQVNRRFTS